ncbi:Hypothetical predicted protein [Cloeon dipterum]|uniref:Uncharacterized protein n=1 Tax=Cloeon dipterum TaxID=197152 RepID=A0A8S1BWW4_9INSE|nr:Hypothetical predicted protein [Cloeon dipterum]
MYSTGMVLHFTPVAASLTFAANYCLRTMSDNSGKKEQPFPKHGQPSDESNAENDDGKPKCCTIFWPAPEPSTSQNPSPSFLILRDSVHGAPDDNNSLPYEPTPSPAMFITVGNDDGDATSSELISDTASEVPSMNSLTLDDSMDIDRQTDDEVIHNFDELSEKAIFKTLGPESSKSETRNLSSSITSQSSQSASDNLSLSSSVASSPRPEIGKKTTRSDNTLASDRKPDESLTSGNGKLPSQSPQRAPDDNSSLPCEPTPSPSILSNVENDDRVTRSSDLISDTDSDDLSIPPLVIDEGMDIDSESEDEVIKNVDELSEKAIFKTLGSESSNSKNRHLSSSITSLSSLSASDNLSLSSSVATSPRPEIGKKTTSSDNTLASDRKPESSTSGNGILPSQSPQRAPDDNNSLPYEPTPSPAVLGNVENDDRDSRSVDLISNKDKGMDIDTEKKDEVLIKMKDITDKTIMKTLGPESSKSENRNLSSSTTSQSSQSASDLTLPSLLASSPRPDIGKKTTTSDKTLASGRKPESSTSGNGKLPSQRPQRGKTNGEIVKATKRVIFFEMEGLCPNCQKIMKGDFCTNRICRSRNMSCNSEKKEQPSPEHGLSSQEAKKAPPSPGLSTDQSEFPMPRPRRKFEGRDFLPTPTHSKMLKIDESNFQSHLETIQKEQPASPNDDLGAVSGSSIKQLDCRMRKISVSDTDSQSPEARKSNPSRRLSNLEAAEASHSKVHGDRAEGSDQPARWLHQIETVRNGTLTSPIATGNISTAASDDLSLSRLLASFPSIRKCAGIDNQATRSSVIDSPFIRGTLASGRKPESSTSDNHNPLNPILRQNLPTYNINLNRIQQYMEGALDLSIPKRSNACLQVNAATGTPPPPQIDELHSMDRNHLPPSAKRSTTWHDSNPGGFPTSSSALQHQQSYSQRATQPEPSLEVPTYESSTKTWALISGSSYWCRLFCISIRTLRQYT